MEILRIKVSDKRNVSFLRQLLQKLKFVTEVEVERSGEEEIVTKKEDIPVQWSKSMPSIKDFAGLWKGRDITLEHLRSKAWTKK
jgi:hypothetical protein